MNFKEIEVLGGVGRYLEYPDGTVMIEVPFQGEMLKVVGTFEEIGELGSRIADAALQAKLDQLRDL